MHTLCPTVATGAGDEWIGRACPGLCSSRVGLQDRDPFSHDPGVFPEEEGVDRGHGEEERSPWAPQDHKPLGAGQRLAHLKTQ